MALKVGELYGVLDLDDTQFDRKLSSAKSNFAGLGSVVSKGTKAFATAFAGSTTALLGLGGAALTVGTNYNRMQQTSRAALSAMLGGAEAANEQMDRLDEFARTSPFAKQVFIQAQQQLIGFGVAAEDVVPTLDAIQNAVAAVGGGNEEVARVVRTMAEMEGQGKLTGKTISELGALGINAAELIGESMGKSGAEIREMASRPGGIPADEVFKVLTDGMMKRFGGATDNIKEQMDGAADRVKGAWRDIGSVMATPLVDPVSGGKLVDWTNQFADGMRAIEKQAKPVVELLVRRYQPAIDKISPALNKAKRSIDAFDLSKFNRGLDEMSNYAPLIAGTSAALFALGTTNLPVLSMLGFSGINPVLAGLAGLVAFSPELRAAGRQFFDSLAPLQPLMGELAHSIGGLLMDALVVLAPALGNLLEAGGKMAVVFGELAVPAFQLLGDVGVPLISMFADLVSWVSDLPTPLLVAITALVGFKGPIDTITKTVAGPFARAWGAFQDNMAASRGVIEATGGRVSALNTAALTARVGVSTLGAALKTAFMSNLPLLAITAITTAVTFWATENAKAKQSVDEIKEALRGQTDAVEDNLRAIALKRLQDEDAVGVADALGISLKTVIDSMIGNKEATVEVTEAMSKFEDELLATEQATGGYTAAQTEAQGVVEKFNKINGAYTEGLHLAREALDQEREAGIKNSNMHDELAGSVDKSTDAVKRGDEAIRRLSNALDEFTTKGEDARTAELNFMDAVERATERSKANTAGLDDNTKAGRDNERALQDIAKEAKEMAIKIADSTGSQEEYTKALERGRDELARVANKFLDNKEAARELAEAMIEIPTQVSTKAIFDDIAARNKIARFKEILAMPTVRVGVDVKRQGYYQDRADGGFDEAGRYVPRVPQMATGGRNILWQEDETIWESYISGKPSARQRSLAVMDKTARRLGGRFVHPNDVRMADGGTTGPQRTETITSDSGQRPIYITINSVESDHVDETAKALNFALRTRGGLYSRS